MARKQKIRLGILFGGRSGEHEVSLTSAASVIAALDPAEFEITAIGITKEGRIASKSEVRQMLPAHLSGRVDTNTSLVAPDSRMRLTSALARNSNSSDHRPDIIFPLLHGPYGEDGTIQGLLETAGVPYIGCGVLASAVGMDKEVMKRLFIQEGLPVLPYLAVKAHDLPRSVRSLKKLVRAHLGYPVFSKPANLGSSVGVCKIHSEKQLLKSVTYSAQFDRKVLIEKGIDCRELECAILGNDEPQASLVGEVIPSREFYDYEAKYHDPASRLEIPARITQEESEQVRALASKAFRCIEGSGLARVDFFMERATGKIWINEINTMPGFTPISMYAKLWAADAVPFEEVVRRLVKFGLERFKERRKLKISPG
jgi:D-alanine-D-alanine ligase